MTSHQPMAPVFAVLDGPADEEWVLPSTLEYPWDTTVVAPNEEADRIAEIVDLERWRRGSALQSLTAAERR